MSRRGRGGGRGRGGRGGGGSQRIGGAELAWDPDLGNDKPQPTATYPVSQASLYSPEAISTLRRSGNLQGQQLIVQVAIQPSPTATSNPTGKEAGCPLPSHPKTHT